MYVRTIPRTIVLILLFGAFMNLLFDIYSVLKVTVNDEENNYKVTSGDVKTGFSVSAGGDASKHTNGKTRDSDYDIFVSPVITSFTRKKYQVITPQNPKTLPETNVTGNIPGNVPSTQTYDKSTVSKAITSEMMITLDPSVSLKNKRVNYHYREARDSNHSSKTGQVMKVENLKTSTVPLLLSVSINNNSRKEQSENKIVGSSPMTTEITLPTEEDLRQGMESLVIHRKYWEAAKGNKSNPLSRTKNELENEIMKQNQRTDEELLKDIFKGNSKSPFWSDTRKSLSTAQKHGFGKKYDYRMLTQLLWQMEAHNLRPDLFNKPNQQPKKISLRDSFKWWNYKRSNNNLLSCPGSFNERCEMVEKKTSNVDAVIAVRDAYHTSDFFIARNTFKIYFILESPFASPPVSLWRPNDIMASYWRGSDIQTPYAKWAYYDPKVTQINQTRNYAEGKTKMVAVFMSNCGGKNNRLKYIQMLGKYVRVDVYGTCGRLRCDRRNGQACLDMLKRDYRFYLAFENSNCRDYITEKFFLTALENDVVPVVLGAHPDDYGAVAPRDSYIHVEDFESPLFLAMFLKHLADNDDEYNEYFRWKGTGEFVSTNFFCRVCGMLHYADAYPPQARNTMSQWKPYESQSDPMCLETGKWYWHKRP